MKDRDSLSHLLAVGLEPGDGLDKLDFSDIPDGNWRVGSYELLEEIGRGGMGIIYRARQPYSNRIVALKRLKPLNDGDTETAQRLCREAEAVASLDHPNILPIYEVGTGEDGLPFFSMKLAGGGSLADRLKSEKWDFRRSAECIKKVARAIQYAHGKDQGILHRDLKPGNILLDGRGEPMVADFGLAKWLDRPSELTQSLTVFGTPGYLAPEQALGSSKELGKTADIYSLGAVFFELLAKRPPFVGNNAWAVVKEASETPAPKLRTLIPDADRDLETICARCLEREPSARYQNAGDVADDLQRWMDGRPIIARPVGWPEKSVRWVRRNRAVSVAGAACLIATAAGTWHISKNHRLEAAMLQQQQASLAIRLLPIFDLDAVTPHSAAADEATNSMENALGKAGRILRKSAPGTAWSRDFAEEARETQAPYLIAGFTQQTAEGRRFVLHWFDTHEGRFTRRVIGTTKGNTDDLMRYLAGELLAGRGEVTSDPSAAYIAANREARDLILAGEDYFSRFTVESFEKAILCGRKAVESDPKSAHAYALLARALMNRAYFGADNQLQLEHEASATLEKALQLGPQSAAVYWAKANIALLGFHLEESAAADRTYLELSMDVVSTAKSFGMIAKYHGRSDEALTWFRLSRAYAQRKETLSLEGDVLVELGMDVDAASSYQKFDDLFPDQPDGRLGLSALKLLNRNYADSRLMIDRLLQDFPPSVYPKLIAAQEAFYERDFPRAAALYGKLRESDRAGGTFFYGAISYLAAEGFSLVKLGKIEEGTALLREGRENNLRLIGTGQLKPDELTSLAATEAGLGNNDAALKILQENLELLASNHRFVDNDPRFDAMRDDPQFQKIFRAMSDRMETLKRRVATEFATNKPPLTN